MGGRDCWKLRGRHSKKYEIKTRKGRTNGLDWTTLRRRVVVLDCAGSKQIPQQLLENLGLKQEEESLGQDYIHIYSRVLKLLRHQHWKYCCWFVTQIENRLRTIVAVKTLDLHPYCRSGAIFCNKKATLSLKSGKSGTIMKTGAGFPVCLVCLLLSPVFASGWVSANQACTAYDGHQVQFGEEYRPDDCTVCRCDTPGQAATCSASLSRSCNSFGGRIQQW
ncbi:hypothetical protein RRG08_050064 [Elysia crispata]|uniref:Uncharacterized protein n=1 Tax=Elysia crispata TaxID=231223 RepID=A0AAE1AKM1_9GAST|nr:hypothetical protein RRG08_050064 [Elysia crispata]